jgi:hypothetical protein
MNMRFDPGEVIPLDSSGNIYPTLRVTDNWGILEVDSCCALLSPDWSRLIVPEPTLITDSMVTGDGWRLKLNSGWKPEKKGEEYLLFQ